MKKSSAASKKPNAEIPFRLKGISTTRFSIAQALDEKGTKAKLEFSPGFLSNPETRTVGAAFGLRLMRGQEELVFVEVVCHFELSEPYWNGLQENDGAKELPLPVALHLATLAAGTARGVFHAKTENTPFQRYFLGTVNLTRIITGPVKL